MPTLAINSPSPADTNVAMPIALPRSSDDTPIWRMATTGMKAPVAPKPNTSKPTDNMKVANEKRWLRKNGQTEGCWA